MEIFMPGDLDNYSKVDRPQTTNRCIPNDLSNLTRSDERENEEDYNQLTQHKCDCSCCQHKKEHAYNESQECKCNCSCEEHNLYNNDNNYMRDNCKCSEVMYPETMYCEKKFKTALKMIKESIQGEKEDEMFYNYLIQKAPTQEEKNIIASIRDDEIKHNMMFKRIYSDFTGKDVYASMDYDYNMNMPKSYMEGIKKAFFGELRAMEKYRKIRESMPNRYYRDMLFEILTDEIKHGEYYNYIMTMNK